MTNEEKEDFKIEVMVKQCELLDHIRGQLIIMNKSLNNGKLLNPGYMASPDLKVRDWVKNTMRTAKNVVDLSEDKPGMKFKNPDPFPGSKDSRFKKKL